MCQDSLTAYVLAGLTELRRTCREMAGPVLQNVVPMIQSPAFPFLTPVAV